MTTPNSRVLKMAHLIYSLRLEKSTNQLTYTPAIEWSTALQKAWEVYRLTCLLKLGAYYFWYRKKDGTYRDAIGTLNHDLIPADKQPKGIVNRHDVLSSVAYFDLEKNEWRSFGCDSLLFTDDSIHPCKHVWQIDFKQSVQL